LGRIGLSYVKERILDDEVGRKALHKRFLVSQKIAQNDPWKARAKGEYAHEFTPLKSLGV